MPAPVTVVSLDDIQSVPVGGQDFSLRWVPVRHTLGITAFGTNAYIAADAGDDVVEPHTEGTDPATDHQELYFVARGSARFTIDGTDHEAPAGTYVFIPDPRSHRRAVALEAGTTVLSFGGPPTFEPSAWEWAFRGAALIADPATRGQAREILEDGLSRFPDAGNVRYNSACLEALDGNRDLALEHLSRAIADRPEVAEWAREDDDFVALRDDPRFAELTGAG
jgi:AraC-like ligand binding domain